MKERPVVVVIAGSDPSGCAGIQMDLRVLSLLGVYATAVPSALTVQTPDKAIGWSPVPKSEFKAAVNAALSLPAEVIKVGMLGTKEVAEALLEELKKRKTKVVFDPVLSSTSGKRLHDDQLLEFLKKEFLKSVHLVTPNLPEAEALIGRKIGDGEEEVAARKLLSMGPESVLLKGGHGRSELVRDILVTEKETLVFERKRISGERRGTGCLLASATAGFLALGLELKEAVAEAERLVEKAIREGLEVSGTAVANPFVVLEEFEERERVLRRLEEAVEVFTREKVARLIPEVQTNIAYALPYAKTSEEVAAVEGRIVRFREGARAVGCVRFGASSHMARVVLSAMRFDPKKRAAMNIRYEEEFLERARNLGLTVAVFHRKSEPEEVKKKEGGTLSWAITEVCKSLGRVPEVVADPGDLGKEAMIRILGEDPVKVVRLALRVAGLKDGEDS